MPLSPIRFGTFDWPHWDGGKRARSGRRIKGRRNMGRETGIDCSKEQERFIENKTRTRQKRTWETHVGRVMHRPVWSGQASGDLSREKRWSGARYTPTEGASVSDRIRAGQKGDGRGWSDRRTGRERAPAQRSQSIALRVARMLVGAEQRPDGGSIRSSSLFVQLFFSSVSVFPALSFARGALGRMRRCLAGLAEEAEARGKHDGDAASGDAAAEGKKVQQQTGSKGFGRILMLLCAGGFRVGTLRVR
ncbi:hypothetical protein V8C43DRAFT_193112 [Trichoderma afarasin]